MSNSELHSPEDFNMAVNRGSASSAPIPIDEFLKSTAGVQINGEGQLENKEPEVTMEDLSDDDINAFNAITESIKSDEEIKREKARAANRKAYAKRKNKNMSKDTDATAKKDQPKKNVPKMPKYLTKDMVAVQLVMKQHLNNRYKDGCDVAPVQVMGNNAYGKECKKNAFERLMIEQEKFAEWGVVPEWFIITRDDVSICDPHLLDRLKGLQEYTHAVGPMGVVAIRRSGKFFRPDNPHDVKGALIQGDLDSDSWNFMKAPDYDSAAGFQVAALTSGMVAIRGKTFMDIDFRYMAETCEQGFQHFIADICMEVNKRNCVVGVIKTLIRQEDVLSSHVETDDFRKDHEAFVKKWQQYLPIRF